MDDEKNKMVRIVLDTIDFLDRIDGMDTLLVEWIREIRDNLCKVREYLER